MTKIDAIKAKNSQHCSLVLAYKKCSLHPQTRCSRFAINHPRLDDIKL